MGKSIAVEDHEIFVSALLLKVWGESSEEPDELDESGRCQLYACIP